MLQPGAHLDIWVVEVPLGQGGTSAVYRCRHRDAPSFRAAVKVLAPYAPDEVSARFAREAEILCRLDHPGVVRVHDVRPRAEPPYLVMDFVEGQNLYTLLRQGPVDEHRAVSIIAQLARALDHAHSRGISHRDVKPGNVILKPDDQAVLVDFGIALAAEDIRLTRHGALSPASIPYAPPEWLEPESVDGPRWDIYALGVVFYEMLTGQHAFPMPDEGSIEQRMVRAALSKQGHAPLDPGPHLHPVVRDLVQRMTQSDPSRREATMGPLIQSFEDHLAPRAPNTLPRPPSGPSYPTPPRPPAPQQLQPIRPPVAPTAPQPIAHPTAPQPIAHPTAPQPFAHPTAPQPFAHPTAPQPSAPQALSSQHLQASGAYPAQSLQASGAYPAPYPPPPTHTLHPQSGTPGLTLPPTAPSAAIAPPELSSGPPTAPPIPRPRRRAPPWRLRLAAFAGVIGLFSLATRGEDAPPALTAPSVETEAVAALEPGQRGAVEILQRSNLSAAEEHAWRADGYTASLRVVSVPTGARVSLGGRDLGETPLEIEIDLGRHQIHVSKVGYQELRTELDVAGPEILADVALAPH